MNFRRCSDRLAQEWWFPIVRKYQMRDKEQEENAKVLQMRDKDKR